MGLRLENLKFLGPRPQGVDTLKAKRSLLADSALLSAGSCQRLPGGEAGAKGQDYASRWKQHLKLGLFPIPTMLCHFDRQRKEKGQFLWEDIELESHSSKRCILRNSFRAPNSSWPSEPS